MVLVPQIRVMVHLAMARPVTSAATIAAKVVVAAPKAALSTAMTEVCAVVVITPKVARVISVTIAAAAAAMTAMANRIFRARLCLRQHVAPRLASVPTVLPLMARIV
jgi:hypothetical protein